MSPLTFHIRIHSFTGAALACRVMGTKPFILHSPINCGETHGAKWFAGLLAELNNAWPNCRFEGAIDCTHHTGQALSALESNIAHVIVGDISADAMTSLRAIARQKGSHIWAATIFVQPRADATTTRVQNAMMLNDMDDHFLPEHELEKRLRAALAQL